MGEASSIPGNMYIYIYVWGYHTHLMVFGFQILRHFETTEMSTAQRSLSQHPPEVGLGGGRCQMKTAKLSEWAWTLALGHVEPTRCHDGPILIGLTLVTGIYYENQ